MEQLYSLVRENLPQQVHQSLQQVLSGLPEPLLQHVEQLPPAVRPLLSTPEGLVVLLSLLVLLLVVVVASCSSPKSRGPKTIVVAGPSNSGKTTLFYQMRDGSLHNGVVASMQENSATCSIKHPKSGALRPVRLVDVPGHASMRDKLAAHLKEAAGVVFLVDAVDITPHRTEAAEVLYDILTNRSVQQRRMPVLIACNKMDMDMEAHTKEFITKTLNKQLDTMRKTKTAGIGKETAASKPALGPLDKPFALATHTGAKVSVGEVSAMQKNLAAVEEFVAACL
jgi:signal recognition particle receptor subunit beta